MLVNQVEASICAAAAHLRCKTARPSRARLRRVRFTAYPQVMLKTEADPPPLPVVNTRLGSLLFLCRSPVDQLVNVQ